MDALSNRLSSNLNKFQTNCLDYLARIRTGNEEELRFLKDIEAKAGFMMSLELSEDSQSGSITREIQTEWKYGYPKNFNVMRFTNLTKLKSYFCR